jgi:hypothetical protein
MRGDPGDEPDDQLRGGGDDRTIKRGETGDDKQQPIKRGG